MLKGVVETTPADPISSYFQELARALTAVRVSDHEGRPLDLQKGFEWVAEAARNAHANGNKVVLIGNGGSAAIASHHAIEFLKNGGIRALALNDPAALTCLSNDLGYANVFSEQLKTACRSRRPADRHLQLGPVGQHPEGCRGRPRQRHEHRHLQRLPARQPVARPR